MFYHLILPLQEHLSFLRLFQYITFRSLYAAVTSLVFVLLFGNLMIQWLRSLKFKEEIRELGPDTHKMKAGTPTMGGVIILAGILFSIMLWGNFTNLYLVLLVCATVFFGGIGFADDYMKSVLKIKGGMPGQTKFILQVVIALSIATLIYFFPSKAKHADVIDSHVITTSLYVPFVNKAVIDLSYIWIVFAVLVIVGYSNAVNLTDGLDGLAIGSVLIVTATLGVIAYITGHIKIADYLNIPYIASGAEIAVFMAALGGAALGFLWFNSNPAAVFMGDTGSLALGGIIGVVAVMIKKELLLIIVGGVFVAEVLSVIIQVMYYKWKKKRVFKMAPIHHHFELSGWSEQKVVVRLWIIGIILAIVGMSTLKIL